MNFKKKLFIGFLIALLLLALTNPTISEFKQFSPADIHSKSSSKRYTHKYQKTFNGLIFSVYEKTDYYDAFPQITRRYVGILKNFFWIKNIVY